MKLTFKQGKFFNKAGEVVPLEFGNTSQIHIIERIKMLKEEGIFYASALFNCPCGKVHPKSFEDGKRFKCECGARYEFYLWNDEVPTLKML